MRLPNGAARLLALAAVTLLALVIRLYGLTNHGVWWDEAYHAELVRLPSVGAMLDAVLSNPPSDPLYALVLRAWSGLAGTGDAAIRLPSVLFSAATVPATYWLGRVVAGEAAGLLAALLLAVSPYALELGQEAALYALASLTATVALAAGWRWRREGQGARLYVALAVLAAYSHYVTVVILGLVALAGLWSGAGASRVSRRRWLGAHLIIFGAWLPWLLALIIHWQASALPRATLTHYATADEALGALVQYSSGSAALLQGRRPLEAAAALAGAALLALAWMAGARRRELRITLGMAGLIFAGPALVSAATGLWLFVPHFMIFLLPAVFVAVAAGATWAWASRGSGAAAMRRAGQAGALAALVIWLGAQAWGMALYYRYPPHGADRLQDLAATLDRGRQPGDAVMITPPILTPPLRQYYHGPLLGLPVDFDLRAVYLPFGSPEWNRAARVALDRGAQDHARFWLVYRPEDDAGGAFLRGVAGAYRQVERRDYPFASLYLFTTR
jgi:4-amino-4-deoxy-L-arabinose transferase-like glycosyltransferase